MTIKILIRKATEADIQDMVFLSYQKRRAYEKAQPQFWRHAEGANDLQINWFSSLLHKDNTLLLVAELQGKIQGFVVGQLIVSPEVYNPGGLTLMIDDFCVNSSSNWSLIGTHLLSQLKDLSHQQGAVQTVIVCGAHDEPKRDFLIKLGLNVASEWYVGVIS